MVDPRFSAVPGVHRFDRLRDGAVRTQLEPPVDGEPGQFVTATIVDSICYDLEGEVR